MGKRRSAYILSILILITAVLAVILVFPQEKVQNQTDNNFQIKTESVAEGGGLGNVFPPFQYAQSWDREIFDPLFGQAEAVGDLGILRGAIAPHHLVGGNIPATLFKYLARQKPSVVVIFGPNHFAKTNTTLVISALNDWSTSYGSVKTDEDILSSLYRQNLVKDDSETMSGEHAIGALASFVANYLPETKIVPLIFTRNAPRWLIDNVLKDLWPRLPADVVFVASIDFSHYQKPTVAAFHDELNRSVVRNFDYNRLSKMEIDSLPSLYALWQSLTKYGAKKIVYEMRGSSDVRMKNSALEKTTSYYAPFFVAGEVEYEKSASLLMFGDIMLDRNVKKQMDNNGADYILKELAGEGNRFFMGMDAVHANLEGPFADRRRSTEKSIAFRFDPALLPMLKRYNFSIFDNANNHSLDMGAVGFKESQLNLAQAGLDFYGSQYNINSSSLLIKPIGDFSFAFVGINDANGPIDEDKAAALIKEGENRADYVIVNMHWGEEYKEISNGRQRDLARKFIDAGADAIIGHHPHVVEEMEVYKNRPIFYSLGNFIFDQYFSVPTQQGLAAGLVFYADKISVYAFPFQGENSQVKLMDYNSATAFFDGWITKSRLSNYAFNSFNLLINL